MAIAVNESVVHESEDVMVTLNIESDTLTFWRLMDTRFIDPTNEDKLEAELSKESHEHHRTSVIMDITGYAKIFRQEMDVKVFHDQETQIARIIREMQAA